MFRRSAKRTADQPSPRTAPDAPEEAGRTTKAAKQARRAEKRAARQAQYEAYQVKRTEAKEAEAAARAETLAGSLFASTPCYDSLWTYAVVFPDRVEERRKDNSIVKVRFLRGVAGVDRDMLAGVTFTGGGWSETFSCKGQDEAQQMMAVITELLSGSEDPVRDD
jgi:hypothetical protein